MSGRTFWRTLKGRFVCNGRNRSGRSHVETSLAGLLCCTPSGDFRGWGDPPEGSTGLSTLTYAAANVRLKSGDCGENHRGSCRRSGDQEASRIGNANGEGQDRCLSGDRFGFVFARRESLKVSSNFNSQKKCGPGAVSFL